MILRDIRQYLELHGRATLGDIALHFGSEPEAMRGMIDVWVRKGAIRQLDIEATCNSTCPMSCADSAMTIYEWQGRASVPKPLAIIQSLPGRPAGGTLCRQA